MSDDLKARLSERQARALVGAARFLDVAAGEGYGMQVGKHAKAANGTLWADEVVMELCDAFGIEWGDSFADGLITAIAYKDEAND